MIKKPAILLLDEATSALDAVSERFVQESIDSLQQSHAQTTIVIAHRLSTIRNADKIAVISDGKIAELGSHDELISNPDGLYTDLVRLQMSGTTENLSNNVDSPGRVKSTANVSLEEKSIKKADINISGKSKVNESEAAVKDSTEIALSSQEITKLKSKIYALVFPYLHWMILGLIGSAMVILYLKI